LVEGDLLAFLHHLEATSGDGRAMEEEVVSATLGGDEAESTVAKALDRSRGHDCTAFGPASRYGRAGSLSGEPVRLSGTRQPYQIPAEAVAAISRNRPAKA